MSISSSLIHKIRTAALLILCFFLAGLAGGSFSLSRQSQLAPYEDQTVTVSGVVIDASVRDGDTAKFTVCLTDGGKAVTGQQSFRQRREKILVTIYQYASGDPRLLTGLPVSVQGTVQQPSAAANPGCFDYRRYLRSEKIRICLTADRVTPLSEKVRRPILHTIAEFKVTYEEKINAVLKADEAAILCGILFGDKTYMSDDLTDSFRENGIGHLLAASGLHVGFVYALLSRLFRKPRTLTGNLPILAILLLYTALAGFSSSVVRAVFMITVRILSRTSCRRYDFLTSIAFCALVLLVYEPASLCSAGFFLSFTAVLSLAVLLPAADRFISVEHLDERELLPMEKFRYHVRASLAGTISVTIAIQLGMTPVTLMNFHYISPAGLLLNLPAITLAGLIVPAGIALIPLTFAPDILYFPVSMLTEMLIRFLLFLNRFLSGSGLSCRYLPSPPAGILFLFYALLFFFCSETGQRLLQAVRRHLTPAAVIAFVLIPAAAAAVCISAGYARDMGYRKSDVIFVDVGQGDCAHLKDGTRNLLLDSGGSTTRDIGTEILMPYFLGNGVGTIDLAVISHLHTDHYEGLKTLARYVKIKKLLVSAAYRSRLREIEADTGVPESDIIFAVAGDRITIGHTVIDALAPSPRSEEEFAELADDEEAENDCSLVVRAECRGISMLFTGDISSELEQELVSSAGPLLDIDILKVAHHGSKYSSCQEFLAAASPSAAVIQVGRRNRYGHPAPEALERLADCGAAIFRNDRQGAVMVQFRKGGALRVRTMLSDCG